MLCINIGNIANITVKNVDYRCIMHDISRSEAIHLLENYVLDNRRYIKKCISILRIKSATILTN